jgi:hypothetical protein
LPGTQNTSAEQRISIRAISYFFKKNIRGCVDQITYLIMKWNKLFLSSAMLYDHSVGADLSAWGGHRRAFGPHIGRAPMNCAPTDITDFGR